MFFIYLIAAVMSAAVSLGLSIVLTVPAIWELKHTDLIIVTIIALALCLWATYELVLAALEENPF
jgi:hypothetical protein